MPGRSVLFLVVPLLVAPLVAAQDSELGGFRADTWTGDKRVPLDLWSSACTDPPPNACDYGEPLASTCKLVGIDSLGIAGGVGYRLKRYLFETTFDDSEGENWICESDVVLLLQENSDSTGTLIWSGATERTYEFIRDVRLADHGRFALIAVQYCLNGTGGCADRLFINEDDSWRPLERDSTWAAVARQFPGGYRAHKSPAIDIVNLMWEQHLAGPNDANCCPSGRAFLELDVVDGKLSIRNAKVSADLAVE